jgi:site-specific recombinase XerD
MQVESLFLSRKLGQLTTTQIYRLYHKYSTNAKLPEDKRHPHTLRHSIAVHMADSGVPVERVKDHLRHRKIDSTMVYFQITSKKMLENQAEDLAGEFVVKI